MIFVSRLKRYQTLEKNNLTFLVFVKFLALKLLCKDFIFMFFNFRVMAAALSLTFGRGGALIGNLLFGFLIDLNCVIPIVLFASMLFGKCAL